MNYLLYSLIWLSILALSYRIRPVRTYLILLFLGIIILVSGAKAFTYEKVIFILFINTLPLVTQSFRRASNEEKEDVRFKFDNVKRAYEELMHKDSHQIQADIEMEKSIQQVLSLYKMSKDMSERVELEELMKIFSSYLKKHLRFKLCRLVLLKDEKDIDSVYQIELGRDIVKADSDELDKELRAIAKDNQKTISVSLQEKSPYLKRLSMIKDFDTLISMPLFIQDKLRAVLYIENIPKKHSENFTILATQFALHFQRAIL